MTVGDFVEFALYDPEIGYYRRNRTRVGRGPETDFTTAATHPLFAELVLEALGSLLRGKNLAQMTFVEVASEPEGSIARHFPESPFKSCEVRPVGDQRPIPSPAIVFSNEWLDALPFDRFIATEGAWRVAGIQWNPVARELSAVELPQSFSLPKETRQTLQRLPVPPESCRFLDYPTRLNAVLSPFLAHEWSGLFLTFDYGYDLEVALTECPLGTARAYRSHRALGAFFHEPSLADITHHILWDVLEDELEDFGFNPLPLQRQEAFFIEKSARLIESILLDSQGQFSVRKQALFELIHPRHYGAKFQALAAFR